MKNTLLAGALAALTLAAAGDVAVARQAAPQAAAPRAVRADADGDSRISHAEFVGRRLRRLTAADSDRDGSVTPEEMRAVARARMAQRADARFQRLDANNDGAISRAEFDDRRTARAEARPHRAARMHRGAGRMAHHGQGANMQGPVSIAGAPAKAEQAFTRLDADRDGFITAAERRAGMRAVRRARMTERRAAHHAQRQASPPAPASE